MTTTATMRALDGTRGAVRVEDLYDTDIEDLWQACTTPERLARWIARVEGDLQVGGTVQVVFTSTWTGPVRIEVCDAPRRLLLTTEPGTDDEGQIEAWLTQEGAQTRLVVEERGLPTSRHQSSSGSWSTGGPVLARGNICWRVLKPWRPWTDDRVCRWMMFGKLPSPCCGIVSPPTSRHRRKG